MNLESLRNVPASIIGDCLDRLNGVVGLRRYDRGKFMIGRALTVKTCPGDNLTIYSALAQAKAGEILVVDGGGQTRNALVGEIAKAYAAERGVLGFVIDGAIRDVDEFLDDDSFGCYARATSINGPYKNGPGRVQVPVSIGGQVISPGDIVVGDTDGLVSFRSELLDSIEEKVKLRMQMESKILSEILNGEKEQSWLK